MGLLEITARRRHLHEERIKQPEKKQQSAEEAAIGKAIDS